jgi:hypothetical protein
MLHAPSISPSIVDHPKIYLFNEETNYEAPPVGKIPGGDTTLGMRTAVWRYSSTHSGPTLQSAPEPAERLGSSTGTLSGSQEKTKACVQFADQLDALCYYSIFRSGVST